MHNQFLSKYFWYKRWHDSNLHAPAHWSAFLIACLFFSSLVLNKIDTVYASLGSIVSASNTFTTGLITFGQVVPQGIATGALQVGNFPTQTDVKNRWSDGSIKFAVVSTNITTPGTYAITSANANTGTFTPTWPSIAVTFDIGGTTWTASPGAYSGANLWLDGPIVKESRVKVVPTNGQIAHPQLEVVFDIRSYATGAHRIDFTVQNVRDSVTMDKVPLNSVALKVNGNTLWSHGAVTSYSMTRFRHTEWFNGSEAQITPDFEPAYLAATLPRIVSSVGGQTYDFNDPRWDIMGGRPNSGYPNFAIGWMNPDMAQGGGRPEIGALNWWEAQYLVKKTQNLRQVVLKNGDLTGAWSNHLTEPNGAMIKLGDPGYDPLGWWWDPRSSAGNRPLALIDASTGFKGSREGGLDGATDTGSVGVLTRYNEEHVPAPMFVAYLISGDRYYVDQGKFWANRAILYSPPSWLDSDPVFFPGWKRGRNGSTGNERILDFSGMSREFAWPLRLVAYAAWMTPDNDPDRSYLIQTVQNNIKHAGEYYDLYTRLGYGGALGAMTIEPAPNVTLTRNGSITGRYGNQWRMAYSAYVVDWITRQNIWNITPSINGFIDRIIGLEVKMNLGNSQFLTGKAGLSYNYYPIYNVIQNGVMRWFDTFDEVKWYNENYQYNDSGLGHPVGWNPNAPNSGYYNTEHWMLLNMGVRRGVAGAQTALNRLMQLTDVLGDINWRQGFAITFDPTIAANGIGNTPVVAEPVAPTEPAPTTTTTTTTTTDHNTTTTTPTPTPTPTTQTLNISNVLVSISKGTAKITWNTNLAATSQVEYGASTSYGSTSHFDSTLVTSHTITLSNLSKGEYHFKAVSTAQGLTANSTDYSFFIRTKPPAPTNISVSPGSIILYWTNPTTPGFTGTAILRSTTGFFTEYTPSAQIATTDQNNYHDENVVVGTRYYYSLFSYDDQGNYSDPATVSFVAPDTSSSNNSVNISGTTASTGSTGSGSTSGGAPTTNTTRAISTAEVNARSSYSTTASIIRLIPKGVGGTVVSGPVYSGGYNWYQVKYDNGVTGWSVSSFLTITKVSNPTPTTGAISNTTTNLTEAQKQTLIKAIQAQLIILIKQLNELLAKQGALVLQGFRSIFR